MFQRLTAYLNLDATKQRPNPTNPTEANSKPSLYFGGGGGNVEVYLSFHILWGRRVQRSRKGNQQIKSTVQILENNISSFTEHIKVAVLGAPSYFTTYLGEQVTLDLILKVLALFSQPAEDPAAVHAVVIHTNRTMPV